VIDLAELITRAVEQNRAQLNASRIAHGEPGRVEIQVNPAVNRVTVKIVVFETRKVA
jgi:hypothetical protein